MRATSGTARLLTTPAAIAAAAASTNMVAIERWVMSGGEDTLADVGRRLLRRVIYRRAKARRRRLATNSAARCDRLTRIATSGIGIRGTAPTAGSLENQRAV